MPSATVMLDVESSQGGHGEKLFGDWDTETGPDGAFVLGGLLPKDRKIEASARDARGVLETLAPVPVRAQVWRLPAARRAAASPVTRTGALRFMVDPSPS